MKLGRGRLHFVGCDGQHPDEEKYRKIKLSNAAFQSRVGSVEGSLEFLDLVGFHADASGDHIELPRDQVNLELLNETGGLLNGAITNPFFGAF
jgi:UBX domain-containing protein 1/4